MSEDYDIIEPSDAEQCLWPEATQNYVRDLEARIEELESTMATIRDMAVPTTTEGRTKSKRERLVLIKNAVDDVLKGIDHDT